MIKLLMQDDDKVLPGPRHVCISITLRDNERNYTPVACSLQIGW